jgi:hypothetical protein
MKTIILCKTTAFALLFAFGVTAAEPITTAEKVQLRGNKVFAWLNGVPVAAQTKVALPFNILIETNGTFTVKGGRLRALEDGDILGRDGMLLKPDGTIAPVMDHVTMNRGQILRAEDGDAEAPRSVLQLGDGTVVQPDRKIITPSGSPSWVLDGELFQPQGGTLPARDTITMQNGQVMVQKDGSMLVVGSNRSIMMNDGTKVMGDGTIITFNGGRLKLSEGQIFPIEGVVVRRR